MNNYQTAALAMRVAELERGIRSIDLEIKKQLEMVKIQTCKRDTMATEVEMLKKDVMLPKQARRKATSA